MTMVRWSPLGQVATLQSDMARLMNAFFGSQAGNGENGGASWLPAVDVAETEQELVLSFDLPGVPHDEINVEISDNVLTVSGKRERGHEVKQDNYYRFERRFGTFSRSVALPPGVSEEDIRADYTNGVLEVRVPKPQEQQRRRIQVGSDASEPAIEGKGTRTS